jgi:hypothetical protein
MCDFTPFLSSFQLVFFCNFNKFTVNFRVPAVVLNAENKQEIQQT